MHSSHRNPFSESRVSGREKSAKVKIGSVIIHCQWHGSEKWGEAKGAQMPSPTFHAQGSCQTSTIWHKGWEFGRPELTKWSEVKEEQKHNKKIFSVHASHTRGQHRNAQRGGSSTLVSPSHASGNPRAVEEYHLASGTLLPVV